MPPPAPLSLILAALAALALPPLTGDQRTQLDTARDRSPVLDEGALYPLLENVLAWGSNDESDTPPADYDALLAHPATHRGDAVIIEGRFARSRRFGLARPGPWGEALTEWVILVREKPQEVAVVYFVDPGATMPTPPVGTPVRTVARFYKLWGDRDMRGEPATYLTFVGRFAQVVKDEAPAANPISRIWLLIPAVILLLIGLVFVKYLLRSRHTRIDRRRRDDAAARHGDADRLHDLPPPSLPRDPAEALEELERRCD